MKLVIRVALLLTLALLPRAANASSCPSDTISINATNTTHISSAPYDSLEGSFRNCDFGCNTIFGTAVYDLPNGHVFVTAYGTGGATGVSQVRSRDQFTLNGPPGPPLTFIVRASSYGGIGAFEGNSTATLRVDGFGQSTWTWNVVGDASVHDLDVLVNRSAGQTFDVHMIAVGVGNPRGGGGAGGGSATMQLLFPNLPAGYSVTSCEGFTTQVPVPTARGSWGRLKLAYR